MKQILIKSGNIIVEEVPVPEVSAKNILVRVDNSCISVGTEMAGLQISGLPLYERALRQPENVKRVLEMIRDQGAKRTIDRVMGKLTAGNPTGYSAAGTIIKLGEEVNGFAIGDRVACAGAGIANHAEVIDVPVNLAVRIPENLDTVLASSVTLGAISMQGVRRSHPTIGETFVVVGLGILGQITAQILAANGCKVIGVDLDQNRVQLGLDNGMDIGVNPIIDNYVERVLKNTNGIGADGVIVTAATASNQVISEAMQACRKKGRVVLVGDVGLHLNRSDFYKKELDFLISSSYGPGRYDPHYEEDGQDYPLPYVRWTENRNMQAYIDLLARGRITLANLYHAPYKIENATAAYDALKAEGVKPLMVFLEYPERKDAFNSKVILKRTELKSEKIRVAIVGASSFAQGVHLPNMVKLRSRFTLQAVMSRTGANALAVAKQYQANYCTTDYQQILQDENIDIVIIATRHNLHGSMVLQALQAGKHVFVEKPLAIEEDEVREIEAFYSKSERPPLLMVGFNRRFAPAIQTIREIIEDRTTPIIVDYRMNAGYIPLDHWVHGQEGGGRNIGEACHIYDLFNYLVGGSKIDKINACSIKPNSKQWGRNDNFIATIRYCDGSICTLTYTSLGNKSYPKEKMEIFFDGKIIEMDDFKSVKVHGTRHKGWRSKSTQKGQMEELEALASYFRTNNPWPISFEDQIQVSRASFEIERQLFS